MSNWHCKDIPFQNCYLWWSIFFSWRIGNLSLIVSSVLILEREEFFFFHKRNRWPHTQKKQNLTVSAPAKSTYCFVTCRQSLSDSYTATYASFFVVLLYVLRSFHSASESWTFMSGMFHHFVHYLMLFGCALNRFGKKLLTHMNINTICRVQFCFNVSLLITMMSNKFIHSPGVKFNFKEALLQP